MADDGKNTLVDWDCGIASSRIVSWLDGELELPHDGGCWLYVLQGHTCSITIEPLESRQIGPIALERTRLLVQGEPIAADAFMREFTLRFVSAGG